MYPVPPHPLTLEQAIALQEGWYNHIETRNQRNNNPGNIVYGKFANLHGAMESDGRFAIFPTPEIGFRALTYLLLTETYRDLTIEQALRKYAPSNENDTETYIRHVCEWTGYTREHILNTFLTVPLERA